MSRGGKRRRAAWVLALGLAAGCAQRGPAPEAGPDRERYQSLMEAQHAGPGAARERLEAGDRLRESGHPEQAIWRYLEAHRLDPADPSARERIGFLHLDQEPGRAQTIFEDVLRERPDSVNARLGLGLAHLAQGNLEPAQAALGQARALAPDSPEVLSALGSVYDRLGRDAEALALLERARDLRPDDPRVLNNLGVAYLLAGDPARAEAALRRAAVLDPHHSAAHNNLGLALGRLGRYDEALAAFRAAGGEQAAQNNLGYVYYLNHRFEDAIRCYELALLAEGEDELTVLRNLSAARAALGRSAGGPGPTLEPMLPFEEEAPTGDAAAVPPESEPVGETSGVPTAAAPPEASAPAQAPSAEAPPAEATPTPPEAASAPEVAPPAPAPAEAPAAPAP